MNTPLGLGSNTLLHCEWKKEGGDCNNNTDGIHKHATYCYGTMILTPYSGLKKPCFSHQEYQAASTYVGLYAVGMVPDTSVGSNIMSLGVLVVYMYGKK